METLCGYVRHIVYRSEESGYTVFRLGWDDGELTCVGTFPYLSDGEHVELTGSYTDHPTYGRQFKALSYQVMEPEDTEDIERYLGSGAIKGVREKLAARIVKKFGKDTFRVIEEEPERLAEIKGISKNLAQEIAAQTAEKREMRRAMIYLQKFGISNKLAVKIYRYYGDDLYKVMEENPYLLADNIRGVGFRTADEIAVRSGIRADSDYRIKSALAYVLQQASGRGHIYLPQEELRRETASLLRVDLPDISSYVLDLCLEKKAVTKETDEGVRVYPSHFYYMELNTAKMLHDLNIGCTMPEELMETRLREVESRENIVLDERQHEAVIASIKHGVMVLTGGPGTGKTTTINTMIRFYLSEGMSIRLAAPTGRAAKRMTEATGYEAQTIHRLLEVTGAIEDDQAESAGEFPGEFMRNRENPLEEDVIIIDEMSMVDLHLMHALLMAVVPGTRLILVGDVDQLPSVGAGSVLKDIIRSECFSVVTLKRIFRQAQESDIVVNAHRIRAGQHVETGTKSKDFFFLKRKDADAVTNTVLALLKTTLPQYVDADLREIQVLTPTKKGLLGAPKLNEVLQGFLNKPEKGKNEEIIGGRLFREGDKIMQIRNNYRLEWEVRTLHGLTVDRGTGIFNGDMGTVRKINRLTRMLEAEFDEGRIVEYTFEQTEELELAYAVTVHKSQGSEYPAVIIPLLDGPRQLYNRNLLYTAVTRAKKCLVIVGSEPLFQEMIQNKSAWVRYTSLDERIREF